MSSTEVKSEEIEIDGDGGPATQQIYIIQTEDGAQIPIESSEVIVAEGVGDQVLEPTSIEQLSRGQIITTEEGELLQVYEEVILPEDGTEVVDDESEIEDGTALAAPSTSSGGASSSKKKTVSSSGMDDVGPMSLDGFNVSTGQISSGTEFHICRICNQFIPLGQLAEHNDQAHGHVRDLTCMECGKLFKSRRSLFGHKKEKHSGMLEVHTCPECGKSFGRKSNLKAHRESLHYGKKFPCAFCERIFTNRSSMNQHMKKVHTDGATPSAAAILLARNNVMQL